MIKVINTLNSKPLAKLGKSFGLQQLVNVHHKSISTRKKKQTESMQTLFMLTALLIQKHPSYK